jgi:hypothetical protein
VKDIRSRLVKALHTSTTLPELRTELVLMVCDLDEEQNAAPTVRSICAPRERTQTDASAEEQAPDTEHDSAPSWPLDSDLGKEYGV